MRTVHRWSLCGVLTFCLPYGLAAQTITSFSPLSATVGSSVTIIGTGFSSTAANNIVRFGQGTAAVTTATSTSLSVHVPSSATYGLLAITVIGTGKTAYSALPFDPQFTSGDINDSLASLSGTISLGGSPKSPTMIDMNGDGKLDLLISRPSASTIAYLQNSSSSGNISFASTAEISTHGGSTKIVTADFDGDGKQEIITVSQTSVTIYKDAGTPGSPNFQQWQTFSNPDMTGGSWQVQSGEIKLGQSIGIIALLGGAAPPKSFPDNSVVWVPNYITNMRAQDVVVADFNGDGLPDFAVAYAGDPAVNINGRVRVYLNQRVLSLTTFSLAYDAEIHQPVFNNELDVYSLAAGDLNGDGRPDLVVGGNFDAFSSSGMVSVLMNVDGSNFYPVRNWYQNARTERVVIGDFDGDSKLDIGYQSIDDNSIRIRRNECIGDTIQFSDPILISPTNSETSLQVADYDGDGKPDLIWSQQAGGNSIRVAQNTSTSGSISFASSVPYAISGFDFPGPIAVGDLDGDGKPDIVSIKQLSDQMAVLKNAVPSYSLAHSSITLSSSSILKNGTSTVTLHIKDVNGNALSTSGLTVAFSLTGSGTSSGTFGSTTDHGDGTYSATFTGTAVGSAKNITATINSSAISSALPSITVSAGAASVAHSSVVISRNQVAAGATATVYLQARDVNGDSLTSGGLTGITFFLAGAGTSSGTFGTVTDSSNGKYYATFTASTSGTAKSIDAKTSTDTVKTTLPSLTVNAGTFSTSTSVLSIGSTTIKKGDTTTITLQIKDGSSNNDTTGGLNVEIQIFGSANPVNNGKGYLTNVVDNQNGTYTSKFISLTTGSGTAIISYIYNSGTSSYQSVNSFPSPITINARPFSLSNSYVSLTNSATVVNGFTTFQLIANDDHNNPYTLNDITVNMALSNDGTASATQYSSIQNNGSGLYYATWEGSGVGTARSVIGSINGTNLTSTAPKLTIVPYGPGLTYPGYSATAVPTDTTFTWAASTGTTSYRVQVVADSSNGTVIIDTSGVTGTQLTVSGLWNYRTYVWRVVSYLNTTLGSYSSDHSFRTVVGAPVLTSPTTRATGVSTTAAFAWDSSNGAASYRFQLALDSLFSNVVFDTAGVTTIADTVQPLSTNRRYFWRITATGDGGTSAYSEVRSFTTLAPLPVEMASFTASSQLLDAELHWSTATEINTNGFEVERSFAGNLRGAVVHDSTAAVQWTLVGFVKGAGESSSKKQYSFVDKRIPAGRYSYRLKVMDNNGAFGYSSELNIEVGTAPKVFSLSQNYPNPFNPTTSLQFTMQQDGKAVVKVYNVLGQEVATLFNGVAKSGQIYQAIFDGSRFASGIYLCRIESGSKQIVKKMLMIK